MPSERSLGNNKVVISTSIIAIGIGNVTHAAGASQPQTIDETMPYTIGTAKILMPTTEASPMIMPRAVNATETTFELLLTYLSSLFGLFRGSLFLYCYYTSTERKKQAQFLWRVRSFSLWL